MGNQQPIAIFWFRRDLRLHDNAGLYHALKAGVPVLPIFIFDTDILEDLKDKKDKRVEFIYNVIVEMHTQLAVKGTTLKVMYGTPIACFKQLVQDYAVASVYNNHDYEPYANKRDKEIAGFLSAKNISLHTF